MCPLYTPSPLYTHYTMPSLLYAHCTPYAVYYVPSLYTQPTLYSLYYALSIICPLQCIMCPSPLYTHYTMPSLLMPTVLHMFIMCPLYTPFTPLLPTALYPYFADLYSGTSLQRDSEKRPDSQQRPTCLN